MFKTYRLKKYDLISVGIIMILITISYFVVGSATRINSVEGTDYFTRKLILGFSVGFILMIIVSFIDYHFVGKMVGLVYLVNLLLLVAVMLIGEERNNAARWIQVGSLTIQPSEFAKFFMIIVLAKYFDKFQSKINKIYIILGSVILVAIPVYLIKEQPDLSTSLVLVFLFGVMLFSAGISYKYILLAIVLVVPISLGLLWYIQQPDQKLLDTYQLERILAMIDPEEYEMTTALQTQNSIQAIGSGQLSGKGLYNGKLNQYNYLPEPQTDFIFSIIGEEFGFIGCSTVLILIFLLILRIVIIVKDSKDLMGMLLGAGFVAVVFFHTFINVGVTMGIVPNTGLPLPFVSYGLSALWTNMLTLGMVLNVSMQRKMN